MQHLLSVWSALDNRKRMIVGLATVAMFATVIALSRAATQPSMALLYSGLEPAASGEIVQALEQQNVAYEVRGDAIFVEAGQRDQLRMILAGRGLPANNGKGYELLDSLSGFGTTAQMFDAAYWRAKEGELARTIVASPLFSKARVHISNTPSTPFQRGTTPTASVTVTASGPLNAANARALKYLVASAVSGMSPADVAIIDGRNGIVVQDNGPGEGSSPTGDRAQELKRNIERLLEARVGAGNAVVEVSIETSTESETLFERRIDPDSRVVISARKEETSNSASDSGTGGVTVASNLPQGETGAPGSSSSSEATETRETINYEVSETTRELSRQPGTIQRISVAVLINQLRSVDPDTNAETWAARSEEELAALKDLVASAIGFDAARGDSVTLKSMRFTPAPESGTVAEETLLQTLNLDLMRLAQLGTLSIVSLVLGLFVIRPILSTPPPAALPAPQPAGSLPGVSPESSGAVAALTGEITEPPTPTEGLPLAGDMDAGRPASDTPGTTGEEDPVQRLRDMIAEREEETVEILRSWIDGEEETV